MSARAEVSPGSREGASAPMTVGDVRTAATRYLGDRGVDNPRIVVEMLLCEVLGWPRLRLYLDFDRLLPAAERDRMRALVRRAATGEPWQYIVGYTEFHGHRIGVRPEALIPRPETELLVDRGVEWIRGCGRPARELRAADVGTGSGCIAIALQHAWPDLQIAGIDVSREALAIAAINLADHGFGERVPLLQGDLLAAIAPGRLDMVIANLPYIAAADWPQLPRSVRDHEPRLALDGGDDGLALVRRLIDQAGAVLRPDGWIGLELGAGQAAAVLDLLAGGGWVAIDKRRDYGGIDRIVTARRAGPAAASAAPSGAARTADQSEPVSSD